MRVATILGTRPELIRLSRILPLLDRLLGDRHQVLHTGQNYDPELDGNIRLEFGLRAPDVQVEAGGRSFAGQLAALLPVVEGWLGRFLPDRFLVLGDTNSSLGALVAARMGVPVYHLEAGNRCHGPESPEEVNRRAIDHTATVHLCYSERARTNLLAEGLPLARTFVVGNPLAEVIASDSWRDLEAPAKHGFQAGHYLLVTLHRQENVDDPARLAAFMQALNELCRSLGCPALVSVHPRTRAKIESAGLGPWDRLQLSKPLSFTEFCSLQATAKLVLSDSGTAPEECAILGRPLVVLRDYMERQEILERGGCVLWTDRSPVSLPDAAAAVLGGGSGIVPPDHLPRPVAATVARLLLSPVPPC